MEKPAPTPQHQWLEQLTGEWTFESGEGDSKMTGTERVRSIGGLWFTGESTWQMAKGEPWTAIMTLGFNPTTGRYIGTWIGSVAAHLWIYDGYLEGNTLYLESEGPSMSGDGSMAKYRDSIEVIDANTRTLRGETMKDGQWSEFMITRFRRS